MIRWKPSSKPFRMAAPTQPQRTDVAVITCHFNWGGFQRPVQNLHRFLRYMASQGIAVYGVEAQLNEGAFVTRTYPNWKQVVASKDQRMFQKEALLNAAEKLVPKGYTKIAWLDGDLLFGNQSWIESTSHLLEDVAVLQPFGQAWWTKKDGTIELGRPPATLVGLSHGAGHPGFAWAARRTLFTEQGGLYYKTPVGSGDTIFTSAVINQTYDPSGRLFEIGSNLAEFEAWKKGLLKWMGGKKAGFIPGEVYHDWHGERTNRQYTSRRDLIEGFDCATHLRLASNGLIEWTEKAPQSMKDGVAAYFINRKEDG